MPTALDKVYAAIDKKNAKMMEIINAQFAGLKKDNKGKKSHLEELTKIQGDIESLRLLVSEVQADDSPAGKSSDRKESHKSLGVKISESKAYTHWKNAETDFDRKGFPAQKVGGLFSGKRGTKAVDVTWGEDNAGALRRPIYDDDRIEIARPSPFIRDLATIMPASGGNLVKTQKEVVRREIAAKFTADVAIGETVFTMDSVAGFNANSPFNTFELDNGTVQEELVIDSIDAAAKTITTTVVSTIAVTEGDAAYGSAFVTTAEGLIAPNGFTKWVEVDTNIVKISRYTKVPVEMLADVAGLQDTMDNRLLSLILEMETVNALYGPGENAKQMEGIFNNDDVVQLLWSEQKFGTNAFDFFTIGLYYLYGKNYAPDNFVTSTDVHQLISEIKAIDGHYLITPDLSGDGPRRVRTVPITPTNLLAATHAVLANWKMAVKLYDREDGTVAMDTNGNDFIEDMRTLLARERVGMNVERPLAMVILIYDSEPAAAP